MTGVSMKLTGEDVAQAELADTKRRADDPTGMYANIGMSLVTSTQHRFETGTAPDGSPWPPSIRALAFGGKTLIESARLFRSITFQASHSGVEVGSNVVYAAIHNFGGVIHRAAHAMVLNFRKTKSGQQRFAKAKKATSSRKVDVAAYSVTMPKRTFIGLDQADERSIERIVENWLAGGRGVTP